MLNGMGGIPMPHPPHFLTLATPHLPQLFQHNIQILTSEAREALRALACIIITRFQWFNSANCLNSVSVKIISMKYVKIVSGGITNIVSGGYYYHQNFHNFPIFKPSPPSYLAGVDFLFWF